MNSFTTEYLNGIVSQIKEKVFFYRDPSNIRNRSDRIDIALIKFRLTLNNSRRVNLSYTKLVFDSIGNLKLNNLAILWVSSWGVRVQLKFC